MTTKVCTKCGLDKAIENFSKDRRKKSGYSSWCKACHKAQARSYREKNPEKSREVSKQYRERNREKERVRYSRYNKENPEVRAFHSAKRRAQKKNATPDWLTDEHWSQIQAIFEHAKDCRLLTGDEYHVDHIIPLNGEDVSGLHVPWNLQVLPADINRSKGNRI